MMVLSYPDHSYVVTTLCYILEMELVCTTLLGYWDIITKIILILKIKIDLLVMRHLQYIKQAAIIHAVVSCIQMFLLL